MAEPMVFAVYMPPHEPAPGMAHFSMAVSSLSGMLWLACWPTASKTLTRSISFPLKQPGRMVPP